MCLEENNCWHAFNPCIQKGHGESSTETSDRLIELPNELLLLILSSFTTKEVRRTTVISQKWRRWLLGHYPKLNFEDPMATFMNWYDIRNNDEELAKKRCSFVKWVDHVLKQYLDSYIDEFRVAYDLNCSCQSHVDRWVAFALTKRVKTLNLDFQPVFYRLDSEFHRCGLTINDFKPLGYNISLKSLCLNCVNITSEVVESILLSCPFLENLCIMDSECLTSIKTSASLVSLKHLDVSYCDGLKTIDISAPKMVFFRYFGKPIELNIRNVVSLSSVFIGGGPTEDITYAFEPLSKYLPQLEVLYLHISLCGISSNQYNIGIEHLQLPLLTTLKVLDLYISGDHSLSRLGWTPLIEACPALEKLTLKFSCYDRGDNLSIRKRSGSPLKNMKTLELFGYRGRRLDIELAAFVLENAVNLQEVIVDIKSVYYGKIPVPPARISMLKEMVPQGVSFILIEP